VGDAILGNWQMSGIVTLATGRPFTVFLNTGVNNGAPSWPNRIGDGKLDKATADLWFDPTAFVAPPSNTYGDSGRGILYAPGQQTVDISLAKRIPLKQRLNLQLRADAFTCSIRAARFPTRTSGSPTVGRITTTVGDNRQMQFAAKVDW